MKEIVVAVVVLAGCASGTDRAIDDMLMGVAPRANLGAAFTIFVDMYHPGHVEPAAVPGFSIVAPGDN